MTTYLGKSCSFGLPRVPFVNCRQFMYLVISLLALRAGCGIWLYQFLIIAYLFTLTGLPKIWISAPALPFCLDCWRSEVPFPNFPSVVTAKDLKLRFNTALTTNDVKFRFCISALPWLPMMWHEFRSALRLCQLFRRCEVSLLHFRPALTAKDIKFSFRTCSAKTSKSLKLRFHTSALLWLAKDVKFGFPNFCSARTSKDLKFCFRICSTRTSKEVKLHFRISSLPGLPKMWSSASAILLCLDCQRSDIRCTR